MNYLSITNFFDFDSDEIQNIISPFLNSERSKTEIAAKLYLIIRDQWRYNPYTLNFTDHAYKSSTIANKKDGHCIEKSILLISCLRGVGIPARLHLAKVKNHIGVERLTEKFGTNELTPHGMVNVFLEEKWLKVSPAFNKELCFMCNTHPLEFDGTKDATLHEYDNDGNNFMEYLDDYGHFEDVPIDFIRNNFKENYPHIWEQYKGADVIQI